MTTGVACESCGTTLRQNAKFCDACGSPTAGTVDAPRYKQVTVLFADVVHSMEIAAALDIARFRDIMPIVNSLMQIAFFLSPVIWKPEQLGERAVWLPLNPFYDMLEIVRAPLLGEVPSPLVWVGALTYSAMLCGLAWLFFRRARGRVAFWV